MRMDHEKDRDLASRAEARHLLRRAKEAFAAYRRMTQEQVDRITYAAVEAGYQAAEDLARMAVEESGIGRVDSKTLKNQFATRGLWAEAKGLRTCGIVRECKDQGLMEVADPFGVVAAIIPTTNPTSTALFKALCCLKTRNAMVASPHPRARRSIAESIRICQEAAVGAGAPQDLLLCMEQVTLEGTQELMTSRDTNLILATGGRAMVKAAYRSGKPAFGVGPGNVPTYVDRTADIAEAATHIVEGKTFDNSTLCSSEQAVIADRPIRDELVAALCQRKVHLLDKEETRVLEGVLERDGVTHPDLVGKSATQVARVAGLKVPEDTTILLAPTNQVGRAYPLSREKLCPVLALYEVADWEAGCKLALKLLDQGGRGHTLGLHCRDEEVMRAFALEKPVNRIVVNSPSSLGAVGFSTALFPSMTLGCGSFGGNITSDNVGPHHLVNMKRLARGIEGWRETTFRACSPGTASSEQGDRRVSETSRDTASMPETPAIGRPDNLDSVIEEALDKLRAIDQG